MTDKLIALFQQPTQFDPPLWKALKRRGRLDPIVWYATTAFDPEMRRRLNWGHDLEGIATEDVPRAVAADRLAALPTPPAAVLAEGWTHRSTWEVGLTCLRRGIPVIVPSDRIPDVSEPFLKPLSRRIVRALSTPLFRGHITTGSLGVRALEADGVPRWRIARALYSIDVALFQSRLAAQQATARAIRDRWSDAGKIVIAVAKHVERESPLLIIDTFARLRSREPSARLVFVGDGPMRPTIEARIAELGLIGDVHLSGYVPYAELPGYYGGCDVFLHVAAFGPWEISVSEAMACGLPVVTTRNVGSAADLVVAGGTGAVSNAADADALADCLIAVLRFAGTPDSRAAVLEQVRRIDVECAAAEIEALVDRLHGRPALAGAAAGALSGDRNR